MKIIRLIMHIRLGMEDIHDARVGAKAKARYAKNHYRDIFPQNPVPLAEFRPKCDDFNYRWEDECKCTRRDCADQRDDGAKIGNHRC